MAVSLLRAIVVSLYYLQVEACLQNLPVYQHLSGRNASKLRGEVQAVVPAYTFSCYGNVTEWRAQVRPGGSLHRYHIEFQVWRPSAINGCYALVGANSDLQAKPVQRQVRLLVAENHQIKVQPGDVVGFYSNHLLVNGSGGIQLDESVSTVSVWYRNGDLTFTDTEDCRLMSGEGRSIHSSTDAAPVITATVATMMISEPPLLTTQPLLTTTAQFIFMTSTSLRTTVSHIQPSTTATKVASSLATVSSSVRLHTSQVDPSAEPPDEIQEDASSQGSFVALGVAAGLVGGILIIAAAVGLTVYIKRQRRRAQNEAQGRFPLSEFIPTSTNKAYNIFQIPTDHTYDSLADLCHTYEEPTYVHPRPLSYEVPVPKLLQQGHQQTSENEYLNVIP